MGVTLRTTSFKFSDSTLSKLDKLQGRFSLVAANRTQICRLAIDVLELVAFTQGSMEAAIRGIQGLLGVTSFPLQSEFKFPAHAQQESAGSDSRGGDVRPRVVSISTNHRRTSQTPEAGVAYVEKAFESSPFPASTRRVFSNFNRSAA